MPSRATAKGIQAPGLDPRQESSPFRFNEIAGQVGIDFKHVSGMNKDRYFPSANGSGLAIFDYDGDGLLDLYFASCCYLPLGSRPEGQNKLYRNLGKGTFQDVTDASGLGFRGFCHGIVAADFDNDGDTDVFLATYHQNTFYLNNGDGTFRDVGVEAGVAPPAFRGRLVAGDSHTPTVEIDAVPGLKWRVSGGEPSDELTIPVRKGQRLVFRQGDDTAARGVDLLIDPARISAGDEPGKPGVWIREIPANPKRLASSHPRLAKGENPIILAEYEVVEDPPIPIAFQCSVHRPAWSSGGACVDFDNDGDLDLYVSNYGWWTVEQHGSKFCGNPQKNIRQYCAPREVVTVKHMFYRNDGVRDGVPRFTNVYDEIFVVDVRDPETGTIRRMKAEHGPDIGHGFGVVAADLNADGHVDLYVANDQNPAFTFLGQGDGTFLDATNSSNAGYDERGNTQSGMGVDAEDVDGDGLPELFRTNFSGEYNTLYRNQGGAQFYDLTPQFGIAADSKRWVGWGCALADFDNDGWPDAFVTNGHVDDNYLDLGIKNTPYEEPPLLHRNVPGAGGRRKFQLSTRDVGPYFDQSHVGRGAAFGDLDNDGDIDIVINHKDGAPAVLRNDTSTKNRWVRLKLTGTKCNRDSVGALIQVVANGRTIVRQVKSGGSMESTNDPRVLIGLGDCETIETLIVRWPSKNEHKPEIVLKNVATNRQLDLSEPAVDESKSE